MAGLPELITTTLALLSVLIKYLLTHSLNIYLTGSYCVLESCRKGGLETAGGWWGGAEMLGRED